MRYDDNRCEQYRVQTDLPLGLKHTAITASAWPATVPSQAGTKHMQLSTPGMELEHLVTACTLNFAWIW